MNNKNSKKQKEKKPKPDPLFDLIVIKMMTALALSVTFLFSGGALFVYAAFRNIEIEGESNPTVGAFLGIHLSILLLYYSYTSFKYIITD